MDGDYLWVHAGAGLRRGFCHLQCGRRARGGVNTVEVFTTTRVSDSDAGHVEFTSAFGADAALASARRFCP